MNYHLILIALLGLSEIVIAQQISFTQHTYKAELKFSQHLINQNLYPEAAFVLQELAHKTELSTNQRDTINYYLGFSYYNMQELEASAEYFLQVGKQSPFHYQSQFFAAFNHTFNHKYIAGDSILQQLQTTDTLLLALKNFQQSGLALLQRDFSAFEQYAHRYTFAHFQFSKEEENMYTYYERLQKVKRRSPWVAGMLSAVIPGVGRMYAGKVKHGVASLISVSFLGAQAYENIRKRGIKNAWSILYTGLFGVFYVGNIWGSALTVHVQNQEINNAINQQIVFDLHIPLRNVFH